jgi:putative transposase
VGGFKSFPIQEDDHLLTVLRYVERNPLRAQLVGRAEAWRWSSLGQQHQGQGLLRSLLHPGPVPRPKGWLEWVNQAQTTAELERVRQSVVRGRPFGTEVWQQQTAKQLDLDYTLRARGRPKKRREKKRAEEQG